MKYLLAIMIAILLIGATDSQIYRDGYVLTEWIWDGNSWISPDCLTPVADLRTVDEMSSRGVISGLGLFQINDCRPGEYAPDFSNDSDVVSYLWDRFVFYSDPNGINQPLPLMPNHSGLLVLKVNDDVRSESFNPTIHTSTVQRLQLDYDRIKARSIETNSLTHLKVADYWIESYGFDPRTIEQQKDGRIPHETIVLESFNQGNSTVLGPLEIWIEITDGTGSADWATVAQDARYTNATQQIRTAYVNTDLSSDAQVVSVTYRGQAGFTSNLEGVGPAARIIPAPSGLTLSQAYLMRAAVTQFQIDKVFAGTYTKGIATVTLTPALDDLMRLEVDGSLIEGRINNTLQLQVIDTSVSGGLLTGISGFGLSGGDFGELRNFEGRDISAGATPVTPTVIDFTTFIYIAGLLIGVAFLAIGERWNNPVYLGIGAVLIVASAIATAIPWLMILGGISFLGIGGQMVLKVWMDRREIE